MIRRTINLLFLFMTGFSLSPPLQGEIIETNEIARVLDYASRDSLVLFNITGTLYKPSNTLSDHQWREYFEERVKKNISNNVIAERLINTTKNDIVQKIPKKPVEDVAAEIISNLQKESVPVLGLTAKRVSTPYADNFGLITSRHLISLGIDLEKTVSYFDVAANEDEGFSFAYGMIFSNKKAVGPALESFLKYTSYTPSQIIVVDNSHKALENVEAALAGKGIDFKGLRYGRADEQRAAFDPVLGTIQFLSFINEGKLLTDEEASQIRLDQSGIDYDSLLDALIQKMADEIVL